MRNHIVLVVMERKYITGGLPILNRGIEKARYKIGVS